MTTEWVTDEESGERMLLKRIHKGRYIGASFSAQAIENIVHLPLRDDDILLCSYPKSGTHWLFENIRCLMDGRIYNDNFEKDSTFLEFLGSQDEAAAFPSPRILNTHVYFDDCPADVLKGKAKVVLLYRNPKDVAVSFYHHHSKIPSYEYKGNFSNYLRRFVKGDLSANCCFDYLKMWEEGLARNPQIPYLVVSYEELHRDPVGERRRLARFLGKDYDDAFLQDLTAATSLDNMKAARESTGLKDDQGNLIMYRSGRVGDWRNYFTVAQSEWFDSVAEKEMGGSKLFKFVYSIK